MSTPAFDWNDIPLLLALAQAGSMSAASRKLGVETSTISRRVAAAEAALGTRLFIRSNLGYQPTDAGQVFIDRAQNAIGEVQSLLQATRAEAEGICGPVRITAVNVLFDYWMVDRIPALLQLHPDLQLQLIPDNGNLSFTRREADFALRVAQPTEDAALLMRKVGEVGFGVYGAERYAELPREDWGRQPWLGYGADLAHLPEMQWLRQWNPAPPQPLQCSDVLTLMQACKAGLGLAMLPSFVADANGLRRLDPGPELRRDLWLLSHRDAANIKRFRAVADWLTEMFEQSRNALAG